MKSIGGVIKGPRGNLKEAIMVFAATAVVMVVLIAALQLYTAEAKKEPFPLRSGDWIQYNIEGTIGNESVGGEFMFYFTEAMFGDLRERIVTLTPSGATKSTVPFYEEPLISAHNFLYDGKNIYAIGDLLASSLSEYDGTNISDLPTGWFGEFVGYQTISRENGVIMPYGNGGSAHYVNSHTG